MVDLVILDCDAVKIAELQRFVRSKYEETPAIPNAYNGKYAQVMVLVTDTQVVDPTALQNAITNINGVTYANRMIQGLIDLTNLVPADTAENQYDLVVGVEAGYKIKITPIV